MSLVHCRECGKKIAESAPTCPSCGAKQRGGSSNLSSEKSRVTAGVLAILLGGIGVHKFYLGKSGMGILYLVFFWTFIPAIIALVEGIIYLTMSDEEFQEKYGG